MSESKDGFPVGPMNPRVPVAQPGRDIKILKWLGATLVALVALQALTKWEPGTPERDELPASVRSSPGGYRSYHFWHSGYHGGK